jgi:hypothetical protein
MTAFFGVRRLDAAFRGAARRAASHQFSEWHCITRQRSASRSVSLALERGEKQSGVKPPHSKKRRWYSRRADEVEWMKR